MDQNAPTSREIYEEKLSPLKYRQVDIPHGHPERAALDEEYGRVNSAYRSALIREGRYTVDQVNIDTAWGNGYGITTEEGLKAWGEALQAFADGEGPEVVEYQGRQADSPRLPTPALSSLSSFSDDPATRSRELFLVARDLYEKMVAAGDITPGASEQVMVSQVSANAQKAMEDIPAHEQRAVQQQLYDLVHDASLHEPGQRKYYFGEGQYLEPDQSSGPSL
jgi:hypothetical protein